MATTSSLSPQELDSLNQLTEKLQADASFITAITRVVVPAIKVTVQITPVIAAAAGGELAQTHEAHAAVTNLLQGKASAKDLTAIREHLSK